MTRDAKTITKPNKNNDSTGILGISKIYNKKFQKEYYLVSWSQNGNSRTKSFAVEKYGENWALIQALEFRKLIEEKLYGKI